MSYAELKNKLCTIPMCDGGLVKIFKVKDHPEIKDFESIGEDFGFILIGTLQGIEINSKDDDWKLNDLFAGLGGIYTIGDIPDDEKQKYLNFANDVVNNFTKILNSKIGKDLEWEHTNEKLTIDLRAGGYGYSCFAYDEGEDVIYQNCEMSENLQYDLTFGKYL